jgi:hypothetical protein
MQIAPALHVASLTLRITRLQITLAKIQQSLPEMKRSGKTVLSAIASEQLYDETSTPRAGTVLRQAEFIPGLLQQLQDEPKKVIEEFEVIRETCALCCILTKLLIGKPTSSLVTRPEGIRFSVTGNILDIQSPRKPWREHFGNLVSSWGRFPSLYGYNVFSSAEPNDSRTYPLLQQDLECHRKETRQ